MTIYEAIAAADQLCNNVIEESMKKAWLSELDGRIYFEILEPYGAAKDFTGYTSDTPSDTELLVPYPYDSLYIAFLASQIARHNSELARYNNERNVFNEGLSAFRRWFVRTHAYTGASIHFPTRRY